MKAHSIYSTAHEQLSQEVGIAVARSMFKDMLNTAYQSFTFSWDTFGVVVASMASNKLFMYFGDCPENYKELQAITAETSKIEWDILVANATKPLPVATFTVEQMIDHLKQHFHSFYSILERDFEQQYLEEHPNSAELDWEVAFNHLHTSVYVYNKGVEKLEAVVRDKAFSIEDANTIVQAVRPYLKRLYVED